MTYEQAIEKFSLLFENKMNEEEAKQFLITMKEILF